MNTTKIIRETMGPKFVSFFGIVLVSDFSFFSNLYFDKYSLPRLLFDSRLSVLEKLGNAFSLGEHKGNSVLNR